jgi:hypothetical protein
LLLSSIHSYWHKYPALFIESRSQRPHPNRQGTQISSTDCFLTGYKAKRLQQLSGHAPSPLYHNTFSNHLIAPESPVLFLLACTRTNARSWFLNRSPSFQLSVIGVEHPDGRKLWLLATEIRTSVFRITSLLLVCVIFWCSTPTPSGFFGSHTNAPAGQCFPPGYFRLQPTEPLQPPIGKALALSAPSQTTAYRKGERKTKWSEDEPQHHRHWCFNQQRSR